ncbi:MAG TPA: hypothetical protein VHY22_03885 [Chthoniobacteraceae bacterium]|nr:hypothetical protein [Chthoniobacteraceae bacterium]
MLAHAPDILLIPAQPIQFRYIFLDQRGEPHLQSIAQFLGRDQTLSLAFQFLHELAQLGFRRLLIRHFQRDSRITKFSRKTIPTIIAATNDGFPVYAPPMFEYETLHCFFLLFSRLSLSLR